MSLQQEKFRAALYLHYSKGKWDNKSFKKTYEALIDTLAKWNHSIFMLNPGYIVKTKDRTDVKKILDSYLVLLDKRRIRGYRKEVFPIIDKINEGVDLFNEDIDEDDMPV